jgi:hypothetical protein
MKKQAKNSTIKKLKWVALIALVLASFTLFACDGDSDDDGSTDTAPKATDGTLMLDENTTVTGTLSATDPDGDTLTYSIVTNGTLGTAAITDQTTGAYTYTPNQDANGSDSFTFKVNDGTQDSNVATIMVTITVTANNPPVADAGDDQTVDELTVVALSGTGTDIEDGGNVTYAWTQTEGPAVTMTGADTATPSFIAPAVSASTDLIFTLTVTDTEGATGADDVTVTVNNAGNLSGSVQAAPDTVKLTAEGVIDWAHWGVENTESFNQKNGATQRIGDYSPVGTINASRIGGAEPNNDGDSRAAFSWSDGDPTSTADHTRTGLYFLFDAHTDSADGIELGLTAPDTSEKTLKVYVGAFQGAAKFRAELPGADPYEVIVNNPDATPIVKVITLNFGAADAGDVLSIYYTIEDNEFASNITLHAATLSEVTAATPTITPPNGMYAASTEVELQTATPGAEIRYTLDNTMPGPDSTLYTGSFPLTEDSVVRAKAFFPGFDASGEAMAEFAIVDAGNGISSAFIERAPDVVDLTVEGVIDWAHWGVENTESFNQKNGATQRIGDYSPVGTINASRIGGAEPNNDGDSRAAFSWSDGDPTSTADHTRTGLYFLFDAHTDSADGIELGLTAPDTSEKTLKVYVGAFQGAAKFRAELPGADPYEVIVNNPDATPIVKVITLNFGAADAGDVLSIYYTIEDNEFASNITLHAATLE